MQAPDFAPKSPRRFWPASFIGRVGVIAAAWGLVMTALTLAAHWQSTPPENRPIQQLDADYVSSDTCLACHPGNHASWYASYHRTMTQVAKRDNLAAEMDGLAVSYADMDYLAERRGEDYFVRSKPTGAPAANYDNGRQIVLLTGSHNLQIFWLETGERRTLEQFPYAYIIAEKKWALVQDTFLLPPDLGNIYTKGDWNDGCINCHTTQGRARPAGDGRFDSQVTEFGIACEACHGEGRTHIDANRNPIRRFFYHLSGLSDPTIANPGRMDGPTAALACGQCHSIWAYDKAENIPRWDREGPKFRPGMDRLDSRWVVQPAVQDHAAEKAELLRDNPEFYERSFWSDGMVRVIGREYNGTVTSPCFKGGDFSCMTCHELHPDRMDATTLQQWKKGQLAPAMDGDQACLQCHTDLKNRIAEHTHHPVGSSGSSCYNCHMPRTTYGLLRASRAHQITSPTVVESVSHGRPNACNLCHLDQTLEWTAGKLHEWYDELPPALSQDERQLSAGVLWLLKGDAALRAIVGWHMGWAPAQQASGRDWLYPYLIFELNDPYSAVRFISWKSLQTLPGFEHFPYDHGMSDAQQKAALTQAYQQWWHERRNPGVAYPWRTALDADGLFRQETFERLLNQRDNRRIYLAE